MLRIARNEVRTRAALGFSRGGSPPKGDRVSPVSWMMLAGMVAVVGFVSGCTKESGGSGVDAQEVHVTTATGEHKKMLLSQLHSEGERDGRGFVPLAQLGQGRKIEALDAGGKSERLATASFPGEYRLFLSRQDKLQLVKYTGDATAPNPGERAGGKTGKHHRDNWQVLIAQITELRFTE
ncbi:MAG: hypothetical protein R3C68_06590 [Myxococcota bacterium]